MIETKIKLILSVVCESNHEANNDAFAGNSNLKIQENGYQNCIGI
jgi:hypothetical protein